MSTEFETGHLIEGKWLISTGAPRWALSPVDGNPLAGDFQEAGPVEVEAAATAAVRAFDLTVDDTSERRAALLDAVASELEARSEPLIGRAGLETALPPARLTGEMARTTGQLRMFAALLREGSWVDAVIDPAQPERKPLPRADIRRMNRPIGPVVVFGASNFPFAFGVCGGDTASALAGGNPVIVKGHPGHPGVSALCAEAVLAAIEACGAPPGLFALLQGAGHELGELLVRHPVVEAIGFTGSQAAGRALFNIAASRPRPIPVYAEMGSLNPLVILPGALAERAEALAEGLAGSLTLGVGQFCTRPGLVLLIDSPGAAAFEALLRDRLAAAQPGTMLNPTIRSKFARSAETAREAGARPLLRETLSGAAATTPALLSVSAREWQASESLREEIFGPAALIVHCPTAADAVDVLKVGGGQLTGTLHSGADDTPDTIRQIASVLERACGRVLFGGFPTGVEVGHAMIHGGPYPATTSHGTTSVGTAAISRFVRAVSYQNAPQHLLPPALQNSNPLGIWRRVDGQVTRDPVA